MNTETTSSHNLENNPRFGHAIVIGGSIAGLTAARVLSDHFARVTLIERDRLPDTPEFRRGAPQARHAHSLPLRGQNILEQQFPGLADELVANGAIPINGGNEMAFFIAGGWHQLRHHAAIVSMTCSRPLLENTIYRRVAGHPRIRVLQEHEVINLCVDRQGMQVTGVWLRNKRGLLQHQSRLTADLVVDASGRASEAPQWLANLGYTPPRETSINAFAGYASRLYRRPAEFNESWKTLYIRPTPPDRTRGGIILPIEGNRWYVTLIGMAGDYPPTDEDEFLAFAQSLPASQLYDVIKNAEPLTKVYGYRQAQNQRRHYDELPRYLEGLLVCGDAAYALNPVYAQGMTAALLGSQALDRCLQEQRSRPGLAGLARTFQAELGRVVADSWELAIREDRRWPATQATQDAMPARTRLPRPRLKTIRVTTSYGMTY
jgi:2-polyprenyl-6-methoxyphenol hydroxylase-like FAD-dependent oxidoreductase